MKPVFLAVALAWGGAAAAQTISIRSGEHAEFSRLVLPVPEGVAWTFAPAPGGYELRLPPGVRYDLGRAFDRIPRDRIRALRPREDGRLALDVTCDCHAQAYLFGRVGLVIDVIDGPASLGGLAPGQAGQAWSGAGLLPLVPQGTMGPLLGALADLSFGGLQPPGSAGAAVPTGDAAQLEEMRQAILQGFADAATQDLLDLRPGGRMPNAAAPPLPHGMAQGDGSGPSGTDDQEGLEPMSSSRLGAEPQPGVTLRSAADLSVPARLGATGSPCLEDDRFDLAGWAGGGDFGTEVAGRIAQITDGRDRLDPVAVEALARTYLAFGFGREASRALEMDGASSRDRDLMRLLAHLIDGEPVPADALNDQADCVGAVALWRALARNTIDDTDERERTAMTVALRGLPDALRDHVAPRLSGLFVKAGDALGAQEIADLVKDEANPATQLAQVAILERTEGPAPALAALERIAATDPRMTPEAMIDLLDLSVEQGRPIPEDTLELARALRFEHGGATGQKLLVAEARALSASGRFEDALSLLTEQRAKEPSGDLDAALAEVAASLAQDMSDAAFLELVLGGPLPRLSAQAARPVADRLADLGFLEEAQRLSAAGATAVPGAPASSAMPADLAAANLGTVPQDGAPSGTTLPDESAAPQPTAPPQAEPAVAPRQDPQALGSQLGSGAEALAAGRPTDLGPTRLPEGSGPPSTTPPADSAARSSVEVSEEAALSGMPGARTLAERRALLATAEEVRARAQVLLELSLVD